MNPNTELPKTYAPSEFEDRIYQNWVDKGYFTAHRDPERSPTPSSSPRPTSRVSSTWVTPWTTPSRIS